MRDAYSESLSRFAVEFVAPAEAQPMSSMVSQIFRPKESQKYLAIAFVACFLAAIVPYATLFFVEDLTAYGFPDQQSASVMAGTGVGLFGLMLAGAIYLLVASVVEFVIVNGSVISVRTVFWFRSLDVSEVERVEWRIRPAGGTLLFRLPAGRVAVELDNYSRDDQLAIIRFVRTAVPPSVQTGWPMFCHKRALPLREGRPSAARALPDAALCTITRQRYDRMMKVALPLSVGVAVSLGVWLNQLEFVAFPIVVVGGWLLLRFSVSPDGECEMHLASHSKEGRIALILGAGLGLTLVAECALELLAVVNNVSRHVPLAILATSFVLLLFDVYRFEKRRQQADQQADEQAALAAPSLWEDMERSPE